MQREEEPCTDTWEQRGRFTLAAQPSPGGATDSRDHNRYLTLVMIFVHNHPIIVMIFISQKKKNPKKINLQKKKLKYQNLKNLMKS